MSLFALILALFPTLTQPSCDPIVAGQMIACPDGHAYVQVGYRIWRDAGELHPMRVLVPALPEK